MPDDNDGFPIIITHNLAQKITHALHSHENTLTIREWLGNVRFEC